MGYPDLEPKYRTSENWYLWAPPGTEVAFLGRNGLDYQLKSALQILEVGHLYTIMERSVHSSSTDVWFKEFGPDQVFNSVMFGLPNGLARAAQKAVG